MCVYIYIYSIFFSSITCLDIKSLCLHMAINMHKKVQIIFKSLRVTLCSLLALQKCVLRSAVKRESCPF